MDHFYKLQYNDKQITKMFKCSNLPVIISVLIRQHFQKNYTIK